MLGHVAALMVLVSGAPAPATARAEPEPSEASAPGLSSEDTQWGGHLKLRGSLSEVDERSLYGLVDAGVYLDGVFEGRLTNRTFFSDTLYGEVHYELLASGGDTREAEQELGRRFPLLRSGADLLAPGIEDDRRFLDLTRTFRARDRYRITHRIDRLFLAWTQGRSALRVGRQAVTWGNGLLFNPMDLVNPFAPSDIEREYKVGDDMVSARVPVLETGEAQVLYVPRRSPENGRVEWDQSSLASKVHLARGTLELDLLGALHYGEEVIGLGATGYAGSAAWRVDATWTFLEEREDQEGFLSLVANVDYSWVWWERNVYGFLELYYSGIGESDPAAAFGNRALVERVSRGEIFTLGRTYLAGHLRVEAHPLLNVLLTVIHRLKEPSGLIQPRMVWDATRSLQVTAGAGIPYGGTGTEFDGFPLAGTGRLTPAPERFFIWATYYF
jgi:hypothetical protein